MTLIDNNGNYDRNNYDVCAAIFHANIYYQILDSMLQTTTGYKIKS